MKIHIVQKGDTLWKLAKKYGVSFEELKKSNSQLSNPDMIMPGMKIKIPGGSGSQSVNMSMGTQKEAPIPNFTKPVKEAPMPQPQTMQPVQQMQQPVKEAPKPIKEAPMPIKEMPKPVKAAPIKEMPKPVPQQPIVQKEKIIIKEMPAAPQPVIPEVDINNYYMVNMANMNVQKPAAKQQPVPQEKPTLKPAAQKPVAVQQPVNECYPIMPSATECMPMTPVMPGAGFCPPYMPVPQPYYTPLPAQGNMVQPIYEDSSYQPFSNSNMMPYQQQMAPSYGASQNDVLEVPEVPPHHLHHMVESSSHPYQMQMGKQNQQLHPANWPPAYGMSNQYASPNQEEDCGCEDSSSVHMQHHQGMPNYHAMNPFAGNEMNQQMAQAMPMQPANQPYYQPYQMNQPSMPIQQSNPFYYPQQQMQEQMMPAQQNMPFSQGQAQTPYMNQPQMYQPFQQQMEFPMQSAYPEQMPAGNGAMMPQMNQQMMRHDIQPPFLNNAPFVNQSEGTFTRQTMGNAPQAFDMPNYADESNG
ncbi:SafA/ExsA family spore coat assembly protein [Bacillus sp. 1P06AnD]